MNEELIKQCARETVGRFTWPHIATAGKAEVAAADAIRLYHARAVAPLVEAASIAAHVDLEEAAERASDAGLDDLAEFLDRASKTLRAALTPFQQEARDAAD